jgi:hypothetical protein
MSKRRRGGKGGRYRGVTWNIPEPAWKLFGEAHDAFLAFRRETKPGFDIGEQDFAIHLLVQGAREVQRAIADDRSRTNLIQPATHMPKLPPVHGFASSTHAQQ